MQEDPSLEEVIAVPAALTDWQGLKYASKSTQIASALKTDKDHHSRDRQRHFMSPAASVLLSIVPGLFQGGSIGRRLIDLLLAELRKEGMADDDDWETAWDSGVLFYLNQNEC